jgi:plasmid maintenance system killer protein
MTHQRAVATEISLGALKGERKGQWSIRVNDQWRIASYGMKPMPAKLKSSITTDSRMP